MNKKIFRSTVAVTLLVLAASLALMIGILFDYFEEQMLRELKSEATYISHAVEHEDSAYLEDMDVGDKRITLIASDGIVLADTSAERALENHGDRDEVQQAMETGTGKSVRYSETLMEKTVYYATRLEDGRILRISATRYSVAVVLLGLIHPLLLVLLFALLLAFLLSSRVSKSILTPINGLDLEHPEKNDTYEELIPLLSKISTQRRTIDKQLRDARQKQEEFRLICENMSEGLLLIDKNGNLLTHNTAAMQLLQTDDATGETVLALNRSKEFRDVVQTVLADERAQQELLVDNCRLRLIANPVQEKNKTIGGVILILDITETANREQLRREFTANVSHELKTPLTSISGFAEMLQAGGTEEQVVMDFSKSIYEEAQRLISLVSDIIKITELDEDTLPFVKDPVDLYALSREVLKRLEPVADKSDITLTLLGGPATVEGAKKILDEMIFNLCDNAVKYNKNGGRVEVQVSETEQVVCLTVRDTGIGIPQGEQSSVFERFYRVDKSHSKEIGGTGLGLSIVKHGAMYHNAQVQMKSTEGEGTEVTLQFPK